MPSVSVPLKDARGWEILVDQRERFWTEEKQRLTRNFRAPEFFCHDGTPCPTLARPAMVRLCQDYLEPLRLKFGTAFVLSGYRHTLYNARIGGAIHSQHIYEDNFESVAADMRFQRGRPIEWAKEAYKLRMKQGGKGGLGVYSRSNFLHIDNRSYKADWSQ